MVSVFTAPHARLPVLLGGGTRAGHHLFIEVSGGSGRGRPRVPAVLRGRCGRGGAAAMIRKASIKKSGNMQINVRQVRMVIKNGSD